MLIHRELRADDISCTRKQPRSAAGRQNKALVPTARERAFHLCHLRLSYLPAREVVMDGAASSEQILVHAQVT